MQSRNLGSEFFYLHIVNVLKASKSQAVVNLLQWSAVRVTAVTVAVGYSDSFVNPRFITNKTPLLTVTKNRLP